MESSLADYAVAGVLRGRSGGTLPGVAPSNAYPTRDGSEVLVAANADGVFARLCEAMGRPDLATDERYATHIERGAHERELDELITAWTRRLDADDLLARMVEHGVPAGRVYTAADMLDDPHYLARGMIQRLTSDTGIELPTLGVVPRFSRTPGTIRRAGPPLGADEPRWS
jgi:succinyl-CoA---D-citramalate CoA-transferase